ncbi:unnamed protein product [Discula destructiva]
MELAKPMQKLLDAGYDVTFVSPLGNEPQPDPNSESLLAFAGNYYEQKREHAADRAHEGARRRQRPRAPAQIRRHPRRGARDV